MNKLKKLFREAYGDTFSLFVCRHRQQAARLCTNPGPGKRAQGIIEGERRDGGDPGAVYAMSQTDYLLTAILPAWAGNVNAMLPTCG
jgi:hypothetical protein